MKTAVDSNIILDIHLGTPKLEETSYTALRHVREQGRLSVSPVVFAECSAAFVSLRDLLKFLDEFQIVAEDFSRESLFSAGRVFAYYRKAGGPRTRILPDFLVGAHAYEQTSQLLTRDRGFYRKYFRGLKIVEPAA